MDVKSSLQINDFSELELDQIIKIYNIKHKCGVYIKISKISNWTKVFRGFVLFDEGSIFPIGREELWSWDRIANPKYRQVFNTTSTERILYAE